MSDITLTATARNSLLSLTGTASLMSRTTGRLTSGLKVASAIDDAVSYFKAKGLTDRAADFSTRKDEIDQGMSSLKGAIDGTTLTNSILKQMKGIISTVATADSTTRTALNSQFTDLANQINTGLRDASYQGLNLVDNSSASLTVYFNQGTSASLTVHAQNLLASKLMTTIGGLTALNTSGKAAFGVSTAAHNMLYNAAIKATKAANVTMLISQARAAVNGLANISTLTFGTLSNFKNLSPASVLNAVSATLDKGISAIRSQSAMLGGNVTFLQSRLDFTSNYINTLQEGSGKLTLADLNEEGANLVSLQTRQQIGVQSLSIAGQQQQAILSLLR